MVRKGALAVVALAAAVISTLWVQAPLETAQPAATQRTASQTIALSQLPPQGQTVMGLIRQGGPFPYEKDGTVFGNRERLLPSATRGHYREYTVTTPGLSHRGARRIVCGGAVVRQPEVCYYTEDHYASFKRIVQ